MYVYITTNPGKNVFYTGVTNNLKKELENMKKIVENQKLLRVDFITTN
jgi:predicted GIY-YIG superfamily endonuclease